MKKNELISELEDYAKIYIDCERKINNIFIDGIDPRNYAELVKKYIETKKNKLDYIVKHIFGSYWELEKEEMNE